MKHYGRFLTSGARHNIKKHALHDHVKQKKKRRREKKEQKSKLKRMQAQYEGQ